MFDTKEGDKIIARLDDGEDLFLKMRELVEKYNIDSAIVLGGVGMFKHVKLGYYMGAGQYLEKDIDEPVEIASFSGNISKHEEETITHLHTSIAFRNKALMGGHLMKATVHNTLELFIELLETPLRRKRDEKMGLLKLGSKDD
jgi:predicted DNA-binding protein with PD1-like motif